MPQRATDLEQTEVRTADPKPSASAAEKRLFNAMRTRFDRRLKDTIAEVRSEDVVDQDWSRVEHQFLVYGLWLEQEPGALV